ncbi:lytic transglycosylase domain-containing protein [Methylobacterium sp. BTF04]|uniref:lytic transglycosylase domain-containing protein n=1 Tax=Methylobacterium sp. BTF04 TaxID=2708300 RepID=UPI0013D35D40|nr:lytic transglycosylase domain-containing protein [Methylobacterium sp. BTF04]NEU12591.1 lytic transglycosylase domain-containing protein [Methylobacterium sp. BTF04]
MFLFTTPPATTRETGTGRDVGTRGATTGSGRAGASAGVVDAIRDGAQSSGSGFDYLLATAQRESALDPSAKAGTSSATGLFQFIEQTWLGTMKNAGPKLGLSTYADAITTRSDGTYAVDDQAARQTILDLRRDPKIAATMAGALTERNRESLTTALGREPTGGDLYAAHVLGARGASALINTAQASPARAAALDMPEAAAANRGLFYDKAGRPRGAAELYALLATSRSGGAQATAVQAGAGTPVLTEAPTAYTALDGGGLRSMFQTDRRQGAVSSGVAKLWQGRAATDSARSAPTYFPRSDDTGSASAQAVTEPASISVPPASASQASTYQASTYQASASAALLGAPLPPRRPAEFGAAGRASQASAPLDLSLFTTRSGL